MFKSNSFIGPPPGFNYEYDLDEDLIFLPPSSEEDNQ